MATLGTRALTGKDRLVATVIKRYNKSNCCTKYLLEVWEISYDKHKYEED